MDDFRRLFYKGIIMHTPGPWKAATAPFLGRIMPMDAYGNVRSDGPIGDVFTSKDNWEDNAHLIAAAPELLCMLKHALVLLEHYEEKYDEHPSGYLGIAALIDKADGK